MIKWDFVNLRKIQLLLYTSLYYDHNGRPLTEDFVTIKMLINNALC